MPKGSIKATALANNVSQWTDWRLWESAKNAMVNGDVIDVSNKKTERVGREKNVFNMDTLNAIPIEKRTTIRSIANEMKMRHSQVYRMLKSGDLRSHTNSIKPKLSHEHKLRRLTFILSQIIPPTVNTLPKFS